ncbi:MAG: hypothetical protein FJ279_24160 [Planctomycetes bacterium]|nr:hypothetical protein [Planctomycetota bacterium]
MEAVKPRYGPAEFAQRGQTLYEQKVRGHVTDEDKGKFVAIDIETGAYELDSDDYAATERLLQRQPVAQIWLSRVGDRTTYRIGGCPPMERSWS